SLIFLNITLNYKDYLPNHDSLTIDFTFSKCFYFALNNNSAQSTLSIIEEPPRIDVASQLSSSLEFLFNCVPVSMYTSYFSANVLRDDDKCNRIWSSLWF